MADKLFSVAAMLQKSEPDKQVLKLHSGYLVDVSEEAALGGYLKQVAVDFPDFCVSRFTIIEIPAEHQPAANQSQEGQ